MNGERPKIEIFAPFGAAFELMKGILFQPFDFAKWCVIGFAAFLSGAKGNGVWFRFPLNGNWNFRSTSHHNLNIPTYESLPVWVMPIAIAFGVLLLSFILVVIWVVARGRFIFMDCVVRNRAAIAAPWREYRREGNSFFLFTLAVAFLTMVILAALALVIVVPLGLFAGGRETAAGLGAPAVLAIVFVGLVWLAFAIIFAVAAAFMVPVMYRRRCLAREAFLDVSKLVLAQPGPFILYVLFWIVLVLAFIITSTIISCLTCCIAGLPYVSSVVLLPAFVWLLAFKLLFLRQFGPEYDVWPAPDSSVSAPPAAASDEPPPPTE